MTSIEAQNMTIAGSTAKAQSTNGQAIVPPNGTTPNGLSPFEVAMSYLRAGLSFLPVRTDGSKAPDGNLLPKEYDAKQQREKAVWTPFQDRLPTEEEVGRWYNCPHPAGIGIIGGAVSRNAELIDLDRGALLAPWRELVEAQAPGLAAQLTIVRTPRDSTGYHVWFRCSAVPTAGNMKLAEELYIDPETGKNRKRTLIETRGEGGYALAPGSPAACHTTGRTYDHISGPPLTELSDITAAEREILIATARSFDLAAAAKTKSPSAGQKSDATGLRPGDDFDARGPDWAEILEPHGWECMSTNGDVRYWRRPGKDRPGHSATTGYCKGANGQDLLAVFSSNAEPFEGANGTRPCTCYGKFAAYTHLNHDADFKVAAKELFRQGYGDQRHQQNGTPRACDPDRQSEAADHDDAGGLEHDDDPHRLARLFLRDHMTPAGLTLRYWRDEWYTWDGSAYRKVEEKELRARLVTKIKAEFDAIAQARYAEWLAGNMERAAPKAQPVTTKLLADVMQAFRSMALLPSGMSSPSWIDSPAGFEVAPFSPPFPAGEVLATQNTLVHLPSLADVGQDFEHPQTPAFFSSVALDYKFDLEAPEPAVWLEFLRQLWPNDPQAIMTLQEWFGYCLLPDTSQEKILFIVGPKRSGKGTIGRILRALIGITNTVAPTLAGLTTNFGLSALLGKTVAIISDARLSGRTDVAALTERLLAISGEDALSIDRKNLPHVTTQLAVRFALLTNELPRLNDPSGALVSRLVLLRLTKSFLGFEDTQLTNKLLAELPGILLWAIDGWASLRTRGCFAQPESGCEMLNDLEDLSSPIKAFLRDCCEVAPEYEVEVPNLYKCWKRWCEPVGRKEPGLQSVFGRDLHAAVPTLVTRQSRTERGRVRVYGGLRIRQREMTSQAS